MIFVSYKMCIRDSIYSLLNEATDKRELTLIEEGVLDPEDDALSRPAEMTDEIDETETTD